MARCIVLAGAFSEIAAIIVLYRQQPGALGYWILAGVLFLIAATIAQPVLAFNRASRQIGREMDARGGPIAVQAAFRKRTQAARSHRQTAARTALAQAAAEQNRSSDKNQPPPSPEPGKPGAPAMPKTAPKRTKPSRGPGT